ncbi:hypothetical protein [Rhizobium leguminosarum]|uniref:hypothetical protein n=1 Tax=Rhizobium leguminosarum TaxID=384 RepID=UPI001C982E4F|nr:hypothetical protein [Rhizobium leguminosarum]MBY5462071.1 hypothetical protein [Rhizobium leguminosarum]
MTNTNPLPPAVLEPGIWRGEFYGKVSGTVGSDVRSINSSGRISGICYIVVPAWLTPPSSLNEHRSVVWIGAVSEQAQHSSIGRLSKGHDPRLLSLTLKVIFSEINTIITLLRKRQITEFHFEAVPSQRDGECEVAGWSSTFGV